MGAISSEMFVHLLNVRLSLQNSEMASAFLVFKIFPGGGPPEPPFRLGDMSFIVQSITAQHKPLVKKVSLSTRE